MGKRSQDAHRIAPVAAPEPRVRWLAHAAAGGTPPVVGQAEPRECRFVPYAREIAADRERDATLLPMEGATTARSTRLPHAPALDGLRAFAVAGVLLYHGGVAWMPGGFLGVDVFFVLSGYLITSLLLAEWGASRKIDLKRFWLRRARRLLPAALLVILVSLLVVAVFLP